MNVLKDYIIRELMNSLEYKKTEYYNLHHGEQKENSLHLVDLKEDGSVDYKATENKCAKIIAYVINGKIKVIDAIPNKDSSYDEQMDSVIDKMKVAIAEAMGEVTLNKGVELNAEDMDVYLFNNHVDSVDSRTILKEKVYHEMVASLLPTEIKTLRKLCDRVFHKYDMQELSSQERRAITHGIEATNEMQVTLIGESFTKTRGEELNTRNLEESLIILKEMTDIFKKNCKESAFYRFKSHLFGNTGRFKRLIRSFRNFIIKKGLEPEYMKIALNEEGGIKKVVAEAKENDLKTYEQVLSEKAEKARIAKEKAEAKAEEEKHRLEIIEDRQKRLDLQIELRKKHIGELQAILRKYYPNMSDGDYSRMMSTLERRRDYFSLLKKFNPEEEESIRERMFNEEREISNMTFDHKN